MHKYAKKALRIRGKKQYNEKGEVIYLKGDCARGVLHQDKFYGAIMKDDRLRYVIRKPLSDIAQEKDIKEIYKIISIIVDDEVRQCVENAVKIGGKAALSQPICFNEEKDVYIKKVRVYAHITNPIQLKRHRDNSRLIYKQNIYVANDSNYCIALYEGIIKGKIKRNFKILKNIEASKLYNKDKDKDKNNILLPISDENDYPLKYILRIGTMVLFYENSAEELYNSKIEDLSKRLYKIIGISEQKQKQNQRIYHYGVLNFRHHQEARPNKELKVEDGEFIQNEQYRAIIKMNHNQFKALVEGYDFDLTVTGEIKFKR
jgi:CRISPR-associated endonuclease Csn1